MNRDQKTQVVKDLVEKFSNSANFYLTDSSGMSVAQTNALRRACFDKGIEYRVAKNTLIRKALEQIEGDFEPLVEQGALKGFSAIMFSPETAKLPAQIIKDFRKKNKLEKPLFKAASVETALFIGEKQLNMLSEIKSKDEVLGEVIMLLQSPARTVTAAILSGGGRVAAMVKGIAEKGE
ncbi:ribosomal protein L10 [Bernardetia litoralis DSM 6794]|uniref:Large ribosomal subunit protein uL10 n=1 Tax=Bernardetia litoralis (strain ATCC 23117 / DSM 6794 / NBRC 15988 / NCIMB 1366 / Fx l1 / Sio-4) TaxID=880071 RepID=I4AKK1_BERLS|nr:50S ribosomal protein L10 [Bernardetia litoralis]AFM04486.1 ribosomal protein L10 [Bernardetia litoralis DSM 6794]